MDSKFPGYIHIYTLCPKFLYTFSKFFAAVKSTVPIGPNLTKIKPRLNPKLTKRVNPDQN